MRIRIAAVVGSLILTMSHGALPCAAETATIRKNHPWGRFRPGSWRRVRLVTETFDEQGKLTTTSIARTRTTLATCRRGGISSASRGDSRSGRQASRVRTADGHARLARRDLDRAAIVTELGDDAVTISGNAHSVSRRANRDPGSRRPRRHEDLVFGSRFSVRAAAREHDLRSLARTKRSARPRLKSWPCRARLRVLRRHRQAAELRVTKRMPAA